MSRFTGLTPESRCFLEVLRHKNSKQYWEEQAEHWITHVPAPIRRLADEVSAEFGSLRIVCPNRDLRFPRPLLPVR